MQRGGGIVGKTSGSKTTDDHPFRLPRPLQAAPAHWPLRSPLALPAPLAPALGPASKYTAKPPITGAMTWSFAKGAQRLSCEAREAMLWYEADRHLSADGVREGGTLHRACGHAAAATRVAVRVESAGLAGARSRRQEPSAGRRS